MSNYMSMGGRTYGLSGGGGPPRDYGQTERGYSDYAKQLALQVQMEEEERRRAREARSGGGSGDVGRIAGAMYGRQPGFQDGPIMSSFPGSSYKTRGDAPRYHEEIPMGGARGVWAIRNDEIAGPKNDPFQNMSPRDWADSISRSIGRRFGRRR